MPSLLDPALRDQISARLRFYRDLGIHDLYQRPVPEGLLAAWQHQQSQSGEQFATPSHASHTHPDSISDLIPATGDDLPRKSQPLSSVLQSSANAPDQAAQAARPESAAAAANDRAGALRIIRQDLGDCTRCVLHQQGRKQIVFHTGDPFADLMFIGEAPGADEDEQGVPFIGRGGQLLTNMIKAMGLAREQVYIANIIKCRPPGNRTPEREECETCSPFLMRQIDVVQPKVIVALGAVAAKTLLQINAPMMEFRGRWFDFRGSKLTVTYHPAYLLRDPRQKKETWKDLQMVMAYLGLKPPAATSPAE